ncbi:cilia- and flagella-associated protein 161 isoform 2-T2 [Molossus nigricans]
METKHLGLVLWPPAFLSSCSSILACGFHPQGRHKVQDGRWGSSHQADFHPEEEGRKSKGNTLFSGVSVRSSLPGHSSQHFCLHLAGLDPSPPSGDGEAAGQVLRYGQNFRLGITGGFEDKMLFLSSDHRTLLKSSKRSWLQEVYLTDEVSYLSCWQAAFPDPQLRLEYEGFPVPANASVLINHCHTNRALAAHRHLFLRTYFGKEVEVAAHTHLDVHRVEKPRNHWMLVTGSPREGAPTILDVRRRPLEGTPGAGGGPGAQ